MERKTVVQAKCKKHLKKKSIKPKIKADNKFGLRLTVNLKLVPIDVDWLMKD